MNLSAFSAEFLCDLRFYKTNLMNARSQAHAGYGTASAPIKIAIYFCAE